MLLTIDFFQRWKGHADANKYEAKLVAKAELIMKQLTDKGEEEKEKDSITLKLDSQKE